MRSYSTEKSESIGAADTIILSETNDFMTFFAPIPERSANSNNGMIEDAEDAVLWVDNTSAIATAKDTDLKPKSRHYALRYHRVRDQAHRIVFCPTHFQKADALTKLECSTSQRRMILHHYTDFVPPEEEPDLEESYCVFCMYLLSC